MNLDHGITLENPSATIGWGISESQLKAILGSSLRNVTDGYYVISCTSHKGLEHELGFHFEPRSNGRLIEFEFFRRSYSDQQASFQEFQSHFEQVYGPPSLVRPGDEGFPFCEWSFENASIRHHVFDRFGPEEHLQIRWHAPMPTPTFNIASLFRLARRAFS